MKFALLLVSIFHHYESRGREKGKRKEKGRKREREREREVSVAESWFEYFSGNVVVVYDIAILACRVESGRERQDVSV